MIVNMAQRTIQRGLTGVGREVKIADLYQEGAEVTLYEGDRVEFLRQVPDGAAQLVVTSPPYNIGKPYETKKALDVYLREEDRTISECVRILAGSGSICWEVGNYLGPGQEVVPLDIVLYPLFKKCGLKLRNRIVWHFEHGLHCSARFSGRYETILWFTRSGSYLFNLDPVRVPQKYPGKRHFKGPRAGSYSGNPLGKNPGDLWVIPNVKSNHVEKTIHPCQFPVELVQRLVLSMTNPGDLVVDPYIGVGSTAVAAVLEGRRAAGSDIVHEYIEVARQRVKAATTGTLKVRPMNRPVYQPPPDSALTRVPAGFRLADRGTPGHKG
jgi:adenine-specific DNA-methyltransferase